MSSAHSCGSDAIIAPQGYGKPHLRLLLIITLAGLIGTCSSAPPVLDQVLDTGELRVVTRTARRPIPISPEGPTGPSTILSGVCRGARRRTGHGISRQRFRDHPHVLSGQATWLPPDSRLPIHGASILTSVIPTNRSTCTLIYKLGTGRPRSIDDILDRSIEVVASSSHVDILENCS